jgi:hypothetical protein
LKFAEACARGRMSKFQPCLSEPLLSRYLADVLADAEAARAALRAPA